MSPRTLRIALLLSLMVNLGVLGALGWRALQPSAAPAVGDTAAAGTSLPGYLGLDEGQLKRWREAERVFLERLAAGGAEVAAHRERMIRLIFSDGSDPAAIEAERAQIARLQEAQQRLVIEQLMAEREVLGPEQRAKLAEVLLAQPAGGSVFERLHRD